MPAAVTAIHEPVVDDVQAHPDCVVTVNVPVAPVPGIETMSGLTENVHDALGSVTTKVLPAIVSVADLAAAVVFAPAVKLTLPAPMRPVPLEMVTHDAPLVAVQAHPAPVVTETMLLPPLTDSAMLVGEIVYEQGAAACVMVKMLLPMVSVPVRETDPGFAANE